MSEVIYKRLGDLINLKRGYDLPEKDRVQGIYPVISSAGISGFHNDFKVEGQGVVTGRYGTLGEMYFVEGKYWPHNTALYVQDFKGNDPKYIYYLLKILGHIRTSDKSAVPGVNRNELHEMPVPAIEDIKLQIKIRNVLAALDQKIELNNRINAELEAMAKILYDYWFVQFDFPDANGQPYKTTGGKMVYNPTLKREIPEGWTNGIIENVIGKAPKANKVPAKEFNLSGLLPVIDQSQEFICGFTDDNTAKIKPETAHIIFGDHTRAVKLVNFEYARGADGTQILVSNSENMPSYLLFQVVADIDLSSYGYARHYKFLKESKCVIPIPSIAQAYQEKVKPMHDKVKANIFQNHELQQLRDWLLPMLMNGQVTVTATKKDGQNG